MSMLIDITVEVTPLSGEETLTNEKMASFGHLGTHFDVVDKTFPLEFVRRKGIVFDVEAAAGQEIEAEDFDISLVENDMFVAFRTGFIERTGYGTKEYFTDHPQLSNRLIEGLLDRGVSIIGIDFAGIRRGAEHTPKDRYCAERGTFIVENLCNLAAVLDGASYRFFTAHTYPVKFAGMSGLPCRVVAEV